MSNTSPISPQTESESSKASPEAKDGTGKPHVEDAVELLKMFDSRRDWVDFNKVFSQFNGMTILSLDGQKTLNWMQAAFEEMGRQNIRSYTMADVMIEAVKRIEALTERVAVLEVKVFSLESGSDKPKV